MFTALRPVRVLSCLLLSAVAAPVATAGELPPAPGLASPASSNQFVENRSRDARISTSDSQGQRYADMKANASDGATAAQRGHRLISYGRQAMRDGDNSAACGYFTQARDAFAEDNIGRGMSRSEDLMAKTCQA